MVPLLMVIIVVATLVVVVAVVVVWKLVGGVKVGAGAAVVADVVGLFVAILGADVCIRTASQNCLMLNCIQTCPKLLRCILDYMMAKAVVL